MFVSDSNVFSGSGPYVENHCWGPKRLVMGLSWASNGSLKGTIMGPHMGPLGFVALLNKSTYVSSRSETRIAIWFKIAQTKRGPVS
jgi:hypothetical protein